MLGEDPHANDDNRFYLPIDLLRHLEDLIETNQMEPNRMIVVTTADDGSMEVYSSNLNSIETIGMLAVAQQSIIQGSVPEIEG